MVFSWLFGSKTTEDEINAIKKKIDHHTQRLSHYYKELEKLKERYEQIKISCNYNKKVDDTDTDESKDDEVTEKPTKKVQFTKETTEEKHTIKLRPRKKKQ